MRSTAFAATVALAGVCCAAPPRASSDEGPSPTRIEVAAIPVPLDPDNPSVTTLGEFQYAGGLVLSSPQTRYLHEMSDLIITGPDRFAAIGDQGVLFEARFVFDDAGRLAGVTDATIARLVGE